MKKQLNIIPIVIAVVMLAVLAAPLAAKADGPEPPRRTIPVTGNGLVEVAYNAVSDFLMKDGDTITVPHLGHGIKASIMSEVEKALPADLPDNFHFVDALSITLLKGSEVMEKLPNKAELLVSFAKDAEFEMADRTLSILRWDESKGWTEIAQNSLDAISNLPGLFVLSTK